MKIGRTDSQGEPFHFIRIKDLHFFRHLLWRFDLSLVKDYLHNSLGMLSIEPELPYQLEGNFVYIPNEDAQIETDRGSPFMSIRAGHALCESITQFTSRNSFILYKISKKTVLILEKLYFLELPLMNGMKSSEKFWFLERCEVEELHFNSFVYRRGEEIDSIYYLLEGQIKMFKELGENVYEIASLEKGRIFGLFELKSRMKLRQLYAKASLNHTRIMKISTKLIEKICIEREITMEALLNDAKSELYSIVKNNAIERRSFVQKNEQDSKAMDSSSRVLLQRRLKTFESNRMIKSSVIENLVYSKKMLFRVKELNERMQNCSSKSNTLETENIHAIRHFNDKWKYQKDKTKIERPAKTREVSTARSPFKRLLKYPSVQRYLGMESMQQSESKVVIELP